MYFFSGFSAEREARFRQIDIPLSRGLLGHRIFITNNDFAENLASITSLKALQDQAIVGSGIGWPDTDIFEAAGFSVQQEVYENLWRMLSKGRINTFNRGIHEAYVEIGIRKPQYENLEVDPHVMVRYRFDYPVLRPQGGQEARGSVGDRVARSLRKRCLHGQFQCPPGHPRSH